MSVKLKDTIYDIVDKAIKDRNGRDIVDTYVDLSSKQTITEKKTFGKGLALEDGYSLTTVGGTGIVGIYPTGWTGLPKDGTAIGIGSDSSPLYLRSSGNNLYHYNAADKGSHIILDAGNYTNYFKDYVSSTQPRAPHNVLIGPIGTTNNAPTWRRLYISDLPELKIGDITNLQDTLNAKSEIGHTHEYLPLKGGTISNGSVVNPLIIESTARAPYILFQRKEGTSITSSIYFGGSSQNNTAFIQAGSGSSGKYSYVKLNDSGELTYTIGNSSTTYLYDILHTKNSGISVKTETPTGVSVSNKVYTISFGSSNSNTRETITVPQYSLDINGAQPFTPNSEISLSTLNSDYLKRTLSIKRGQFYYAGNGYVSAGSFGNIDLAGCTVMKIGDSSNYTHLYITSPTQNTAGAEKTVGQMFYYVHNTGYSPTWYRVLNNENWSDYCASTTHTHGLKDYSLVRQVEDTSVSSGWQMLDPKLGTSRLSGYSLRSIRTMTNAPDWLEGNYGSGIMFGGSDTRGVISVSYGGPKITIAGGNGYGDSEPNWYIKLTGSAGKTYNLNNIKTYTLTTGSTNGTVAFNNIDIPVKGLGTAAYKAESYFALSGHSHDLGGEKITGVLPVSKGGTGQTSLTSGYALIGNGTGNVSLRAITNNTSKTYISASTNLITANTLKYWNGAYNSSNNSNLTYCSLGAFGDIVTHSASSFVLKPSSDVGSSTKGIYYSTSTGFTAMTYTLSKSVPSDAKFTDTTYSAGSGISINSSNQISNTGVRSISLTSGNKYILETNTGGTVGKTTLPFIPYSGKALTSSINFDDYYYCGSYNNTTGNGSGNTNAPGTYGLMLVFGDNSGYAAQLHISSGNEIKARTRYYRGSGMSWYPSSGSWTNILTSLNSSISQTGTTTTIKINGVERKITVPSVTTYTLTTGTSSGTVAFNGTNVKVKDINTAAYKADTYFAKSDHTHSNYYDYNLSRTANTVLAAPNGSNGSATFRKLVAADLPAAYLPIAGGTMVNNGKSPYGVITTAPFSGASRYGGINMGGTDVYATGYNGNALIVGGPIRFSTTKTWDMDTWAGLKYVHSSKSIYLGLADKSNFVSNNAQSGGKLYTPGISTMYIGTSYTVLHSNNYTNYLHTYFKVQSASSSNTIYPFVVTTTSQDTTNGNKLFSNFSSKVGFNPYTGTIESAGLIINASKSYSLRVTNSYAGNATTAEISATSTSNYYNVLLLVGKHTQSSASYATLEIKVGKSGTASQGGGCALNTNGWIKSKQFATDSDRRLKYDIQKLSDQDVVKAMDNIDLVSFKFKEGGGLSYGFIAQDVLKYFPTVVGHDSVTDIYSLDYTQCLVLKIANLERKIKELKAEIEILKQQ